MVFSFIALLTMNEVGGTLVRLVGLALCVMLQYRSCCMGVRKLISLGSVHLPH